MRENNVIEVTNVTMRYKLTTEKINNIKHFLIKKMKKELEYEEFYALNNVSFSVQKGEVFGVVGTNGAGKSTLLKVIAGVLQPTEGTIRRNGTIAPLIELGAGFNGDLTGIENIFLNGLLLGYSKKILNEKLEEIIEFSDLRKFIHTPVKNYSSGMKVRLGFAIATIVQPDILIVDEVLSVGDFKFKEKSEEKIREMISNGTTVLFVSHSAEQVRKLCDRVLWLNEGKVKKIDKTDIVLSEYYKS